MPSTSNDRNKEAMRDQTSTNLNKSGIEGVRVCSPPHGKGTPYTTTNPHPDRNRK
jgi:hypothetical protein